MSQRFCKRCGKVFTCTAWGGEQRICLACDMRPIWLKGKSTLTKEVAILRFPKLFKHEKSNLFENKKWRF